MMLPARDTGDAASHEPQPRPRAPQAARYRTAQFFAAVRARRSPPSLEPAREVLGDELFALFVRMPPEDQRHGLEVFGRLEATGNRDPILLRAALLHDLGKAEAGVGLPHRVARVVLRAVWPPLWQRLAAAPTGWRRPFWAVANHPARGAVWVETAGGDPDLCALIRYHESAAPAEWRGSEQARRLAALQEIDALC